MCYEVQQQEINDTICTLAIVPSAIIQDWDEGMLQACGKLRGVGAGWQRRMHRWPPGFEFSVRRRDRRVRG
jgi:hypothetical protein